MGAPRGDEKTSKDSNALAERPVQSQPGKRKAEDVEQPAHDNKKAKAEGSPPAEDEKENLSPPTTPRQSQRLLESDTETNKHERTPGRIGPRKRDESSLTPDIKPFKGPPGKKIRKTAFEKNQEYKQFIRENEGHSFHELYVCFDKGPNGSPTYDKSGFELDYNKVADWMKPKAYNKGAMVRGMEKRIDRVKQEEERMVKIFFEQGEAPERSEYLVDGAMYWKDRVSKDLNIPWHRIGVEHFEQWEKQGFKKARRGEYQKFSEEERERMMSLLSGASLRK